MAGFYSAFRVVGAEYFAKLRGRDHPAWIALLANPSLIG
jgi:hypothetical protein